MFLYISIHVPRTYTIQLFSFVRDYVRRPFLVTHREVRFTFQFSFLFLRPPGRQVFHGETPRRKLPAAPLADVQRRVETAAPDQFAEERAVEVVAQLLRHVDMEDQRLLREDGRGQGEGGHGAGLAAVLHQPVRIQTAGKTPRTHAVV